MTYVGRTYAGEPYATRLAPATGHAAVVLADAPLLYWKLDETSGTTVADSSGYGHAGISENGMVVGQPSLLGDGTGRSAYFDGSDDDAFIGTAAWMNTTALTVEARVQLAAGALNPSDARVIMGRDGSAGSRGWNLNLGTANKFQFSAFIAGVQKSVTGTTVATVGPTYTVAGSYDGATLKIYVNGVLEGTLAVTGALAQPTVLFAIGNMQITASQAAYNWRGYIDEVAWYGTALSDGRLRVHHADAVAATRPIPVTYASEVLSDSPSAYWRLGESSGPMGDSTGYGRTGNFTTATQAQPSLLYNDTNFSATNPRASVPYAAWMDTPATTLEAIIKPSSITGTMAILDRDADSGASPRVYQWRMDSGRLIFIWWTSGAGPMSISGSTVMSPGTTYHVAATWDGTTARLYVDGLQDGVGTGGSGGLVAGLWQMVVGAHASPNGITPFSGTMDELAVYGTALSATRIAAHSAASKAPPAPLDTSNQGIYRGKVLNDAPLGYWRMGDAASPMTDETGNGRTGTYSATLGQAGLLVGDSDKALTLGGVSDYAVVNAATWMNVSSLTLEALIRPTGGNSTLYRSILDRDSTTSSERVWELRITNTGKLEFLWFNNSGTPLFATGVTTLAADTTYHVAATYDDTTKIARIFINGVQDATSTGSGTMKIANTPSFTVGATAGIGGRGQWFAGKIDEVAFYGTALTPATIAAHYSAASTGPVTIIGGKVTEADTARTGKVAQNYSATILADKPWGYWRLAEGIGATAFVDESGNGRNMAISGFADWTRAVQTTPLAVGPGQAWYCDWDTPNNYGRTSAAFDPNTDATLEIWWKTDRAAIGGSSYETFLGNGSFSTGTGQTEFSMGLDGADLPYAYVYDGVTTVIKGSTPLSQNVFHHIVLVSNSTGMKLWVDGVIVASSTHHLVGTSRTMWLHGSGYQPGNTPTNKGHAAEPAVYKYALSDAQVLNHYNAARAGAAASGSTIVGTRPGETDTARAGATTIARAPVTILGGKVVETDTARAGAVTKAPVTKVGGRATEVDAARAGLATIRQVLLGGRATEGDVARVGATVIGPRTAVGGRVAEVDAARPGAATITRAPVTIVGKCPVETDTARAGSLHSGALTRIAGGKVVETDLARRGQVATSTQTVVRTHRWTLYDPLLAESFEFPLNPNKMTTPHSPRNFHIIATAPSGVLTGGSRQGLGRVVELAREPFEWTFSGRIKTEAHYQQLLRWSTKVTRLQLTDHLGRTWLIRPLAFNPNELIPTQRSPWRYEYDFKVLNYGVVT